MRKPEFKTLSKSFKLGPQLAEILNKKKDKIKEKLLEVGFCLLYPAHCFECKFIHMSCSSIFSSQEL